MGLLKSIGGSGSGLTADQLALIVNATASATPNTLVLRDGSGNANVNNLGAFNITASGLTVGSINGLESLVFDANVDNIIYARYSTDEGSGVLLTFHDSNTNADTLILGGNYIHTASGVFSSSLTVNGPITTSVGGVNALNVGTNNGTPVLNGGIVGNYNYAGSVGATAFGFFNNVTGASVNSTTAAVTGTPTSGTVGKFSTAIGYSNRASADWGVAVGYNNVVTTGPQNVAIGYGCQATGAQQSAAFGISVTNSSANSVLVGWSTRTLKFDSLGITTTSQFTSTGSISAATISGNLYSNNYGEIDGTLSDLYNQISNVYGSLGDMAYQNSGSVNGFTMADNSSIAFNAYSLGGYQLYVYNYDEGDYTFTLDDGGNIYAAGYLISNSVTTNTANINFVLAYNQSATTPINFLSPITLNRSGFGTTSTDGLLLTNTTAATAGTLQYSPRIRLRGNAWDTTALVSKTVDIKLEAQPVSATTALLGNGAAFAIAASLNGAAYSNLVSWNQFGAATFIGTVGGTQFSTTNGGITCNHTGGGLGTTSTDSVVLDNNVAATSGTTVQISPRLRFRGRAWKSNATAASQTQDWIIENLPATGAASTTSTFRIGYSNNGGSYSYPFSIDSATGNLTTTGDVTTSGNLTTTGDVTTSGKFVTQSDVWASAWVLRTAGGSNELMQWACRNTSITGANFGIGATNSSLGPAYSQYVSGTNASGDRYGYHQFAANNPNNATSGTTNYLQVLSSVSQSGTAAFSDFLINRTQTSAGSGAQLSIDVQLNSSRIFSVSTTGKVVAAAAITSGVGSLTDAATVATDASAGNHFRVTLGGNRTLGNPTNGTDGQKVTWELIQDGTGSRTITLDTKFALGNDISSVTLTTTASKRDFLTAVYNSSADKWYVVGFVGGY